MRKVITDPLLSGSVEVRQNAQSFDSLEPGNEIGRNRALTTSERFVSFASGGMKKVSSFVNISRDDVAQIKAKASYHGWRYGLCAGAAALLTFFITTWLAIPEVSLAVCGDKQENVQVIKHFSQQSNNFVAVNLGGWLCLEDWFHSGSVGRYVSTPDTLPQGQGACLPPLLTGPLEEPWPSEGILVDRLHKSDASPEEIFTAFRKSFITEVDFAQIASLGIGTVRIPISWAMFADVLAVLDKSVYGSHDPGWEAVVVPDPFHVDKIKMVTIPRQWFKSILEQAAQHGLKVILDLHNMPGGSSDGTYSGIWPLRPAFWNETAKFGNGSVPLRRIGLMLVEAMIDFISNDLADLAAAGHIWGVCFMNEPAHLAGLNGKWGRFATSDQVLHDISLYADRFRRSSLPEKGVRMYIQLIETAWKSSADFDSEVTQWYHSFFSARERYAWAVIARHFYTAWGCNGMITQGSAYQCDESIDKIRGVLNPCITGFAKDFAMKFHGLRAVTEWSIGSYWDANYACQNSNVLRALFARVQAHSSSSSFGGASFFASLGLSIRGDFMPAHSSSIILSIMHMTSFSPASVWNVSNAAVSLIAVFVL